MSFRFAQRLTTQSARAASRSARPAFANAARAGARRNASSSGGSSGGGSDMPWMIGSAVVFGPLLAYLIMPSGGKAAHHGAEGHNNGSPGTFVPHGSDSGAEPVEHAPVVTTDDEGTKMPEAAVKSSLKESYSTDSPRDGEAYPQGSSAAMTDDEGNSISSEQALESKSHSIADSPKDAQSAEEKGASFDKGAPGQDEQSEGDVDQKEKPGKDADKDAGQGEKPSDDSGVGQIKEPTNVGDARKQTSQGTSSGQDGQKEHS